MPRTIPGGYRFIGKIKPEPPVEMPLAEQLQSVELVPVTPARSDTRWKWIVGVMVATALVAAAVLVILLSRKPANSTVSSQPMIAVPFTS
jgi:hypothetical protein